MLQSSDELTKQKEALRVRMLELRRHVASSERQQVESRVCQALEALVKERKASVIHSFIPMGLELNHLPFLEKCLDNGLSVITTKTLPKRKLLHLELTDLNDLDDGVFRTKFPRNGKEWLGHYDIIIVPGLAFDANNNRLGYGGGYYDTFLAEHPNALKVALAFPFQIIERVPIGTHDQKVDLVLN